MIKLKFFLQLSCGKEELILYSNDENARSEDWVDIIDKTIEKHRKDAATLKKEESTRREPIRRPEMLKMRRDSLSQIMFNASRHKVATAATEQPHTATPEDQDLDVFGRYVHKFIEFKPMLDADPLMAQASVLNPSRDVLGPPHRHGDSAKHNTTLRVRT